MADGTEQTLEAVLQSLETVSFEQRVHAVERLLERLDFYSGRSKHSLQLALSLPLPSIRLARLSCELDTLKKASSDQWMDVGFSEEEEKRFARFQIFSKKFLEEQDYQPLPLLHLTPRLILNPIGIAVEVVEDKGPQKTKKKSRSRKKRAKDVPSTRLDIEVVDSHDQIEDDLDHIESIDQTLSLQRMKSVETSELSSSLAPRRIHSFSISKEKVDKVLQTIPETAHVHVEQLCESYEEQLSVIREHYDSAIQSLNLRLYIANNQIENLTEEMAKLLAFSNSK